MSLIPWTHLYAAFGFPRVSGDEPTALMRAVARVQFSPRERG